MLAPEQIRMARAALGWSARELAEAADVAQSTIVRYETGKGGLHTSSLKRIEDALASRGLIFLDDGDSRPGGRGVRFRSA